MEMGIADKRPRLHDIVWVVSAALLIIGLATWRMKLMNSWVSDYHAIFRTTEMGVGGDPSGSLEYRGFPGSLKDWLWANHSLGMWGIWGLSILTLLIGIGAASKFRRRRGHWITWIQGGLSGLAGSLAFVGLWNL